MQIANIIVYNDLDIIVFDVFKDPVGDVDVGGALLTPHVYLVGNENSVFVPYYIGFWGDLWYFGV